MIDNKRIADETAKLQIRDFYLASSPPSESFMVKYQGHVPHSSPVKSHPERMPEMQNVTPRYGSRLCLHVAFLACLFSGTFDLFYIL